MKNIVVKNASKCLLFGALLVSPQVFSGNKVVQPVSANPTFIFGNLGDARNSVSTTELLTIEDYGTSMMVIGVMASGSQAMCVTSNATVMAQLRGANSDAQIRVNITPTSQCSNVYVNTSSRNAPKI